MPIELMRAANRLRDTYGSKVWRLTHLYKIRDKRKQLQYLRLNAIQRRILAHVLPGYLAGQPINHFDLKFRQGGVSTFWLLWWLDETIHHKNNITGVLSDDRESLGYLWKIVRTAFLSLPDRLKPKLKDDSKTALSFPDIHSDMFVSLEIKSTALHNLHISEYCYCDPIEIERTLGAASPGTNITMESTGNGFNHGRDKYLDMKATGKALFHPWFFQEEYRLPLDPTINNDKTKEEHALIQYAQEKYGLHIENAQFLYRRAAKKALKELFHQEMAEDDNTCFLASGNTYFDGSKAEVLYREAEVYAKEHLPAEVGDDYIAWEKPESGCVYAAGADTSEGVGMDYSVLAIYNVTKRRQAFRYRARTGVDNFYRVCDRWGRAYGNALLAVELNNHGHAVLLGLKEICQYPHLYAKRSDTRLSTSGQVKLKTGFETTKQSKMIALDQFRIAIEGEFEDDAQHFSPEFKVHDLELLAEMFTFRDEGGTLSAIAGKHDDCIMAWAIAYQMYIGLRRQERLASGHGILVGGQRESAE